MEQTGFIDRPDQVNDAAKVINQGCADLLQLLELYMNSDQIIKDIIDGR